MQHRLPLEFKRHTADAMLDLAQHDLHSGKVMVLGSNHGENTDLETLEAFYLTKHEGNHKDGLVPISEGYPFVSLQLEALIPAYLGTLLSDFGIQLGSGGIPAKYILPEPLIIKDSPDRGRYRFPFVAVNESSKMPVMEIAQQALATTLHELIHALGCIRLQRDVELGFTVRQMGLSIHGNRKLFVFFNEALNTLTQYHFLSTLMRFKMEPMSVPRVLDRDDQCKLNGFPLRDIFEATGIVEVSQGGIHKGQTTLRLWYSRYSQGESLAIKDLEDAVTNENWNAKTKIRDRQYLIFDSGYAINTHYMRIFAHELYPHQTSRESEWALHKALMTANLTGNLKPITSQMKQSLGENSDFYIKALSRLSDCRGSTTNMQLAAFASFVNAAKLPRSKKREVRDELAKAILAS